MTEHSKEEARKKIDSLQPIHKTNLWGGICTGLKLFKPEDGGGRVPAMMILTDGMPNLG
jgi:Mg-chelatase subunit ChlD